MDTVVQSQDPIIPKPLLERLEEVEALGFRQYYFQFTLNDYVREELEPNVPPVAERIDTFKRLADRIGKERVIWRFDTLMVGCAVGTKLRSSSYFAKINCFLDKKHKSRQKEAFASRL